LRSGHYFGQLIGLRGRKKMSALRLKLVSYSFLNRSVTNYSLLRSADGPVVESLSSQNVLHGFGNIGSSFDEHGNVPGTDTKRGFSRRICRAHQADAAGSK